METEKKSKKCESKCCSPVQVGTGGGGIYCVGFIGAVVYYIGTATTFWGGVWGFIKALVWPALLVFEALKFFGM